MSPWRLAARRFRRNRPAVRGAAVVLLLALGAVAAPLVTADPLAQPDPVRLQDRPPSLAHPLGTDPFSRDVLSRTLHGARVSLVVGVGAALLAVTLGAGVGLAAGLAGRRTDQLLMRGVDVAIALPRILLLLAVFAVWEDAPAAAVVGLIAATGWFQTSRIVRAAVLSLREADFVVAARAIGAPAAGIVRRHLLPHVAAPVIVSASLDVGNIILLEAGLSYLGLGVRPPTPTWGNMIMDGKDVLLSAPWVALAPGLALVATVVAFNLAADGLRDAFDPRTAA
ncbi:MAG TPA: ABC transporter permease [Gemmatimonadales bacterium]|nr:ABC transporter permease [Gemmatimonadales bacterium]